MKKLVALLFSCLFFFAVNAQTDSSKIKDSVNNALLNNYNNNLKEIEQHRIEDSLKRAALEKQINELKTTDNLKKEELQQQINDLNEKDTKRLADKKKKVDSLRATAKAFPVLGFFNDTLFVIYSKSGSFSASERAEAVTERINKLKDDPVFSSTTLQVNATEFSADITNGENAVMSISETDALWNNISKEELAKGYRDIISQAVIKYKHETSFITLIKEIGLALAVLLALGALLYFTGKLFSWITRKVKAQEGTRFTGLKIRNYTLRNASQQVNFFITIVSILKWVVVFLLIYVALPIVFAFFPWTQNFAKTLFGYVFDPLKNMASGIWHYLPNLFTIIVIFFVFRFAVKGIQFLKKEVAESKLTLPGFYPDWANPTFQILKVVLYAFMFVLIYPYLPGSDTPIFRGVSVFLGFLFTFGSAGSLSNIIAGIILTYMRLFKIGDRVKIGDVTGDVIEKTLLVTRIRTIKNEIISIPNSTAMNSYTINYSNAVETGKGLILHTTVTIGYDVPWKDIHQALLSAADRTQLLLKDPRPFVLQTSLDDFYVSYQVNAYTLEPNRQALIYSDLLQHIQDCCNEMGIEILSPHYRAARDGNATTIPANYLDKDYKAPGFTVNFKSKQ